jgi:threonine synthase
MSTLTGLQCHVCKTPFPAEALYVCDQCFGPLEPVYDMDRVRATLTREAVESRPRNVWRFRELLPITGEPRTGFTSGWTPLVAARHLAERLGVRELYIKDDGVNHPTLSYKDRVVSVAATRAVELGFTTFGCASTGNLGNSVAAHAARLGLACYVFIPDNLEPNKVLGSGIYQPTLLGIRGNYDDVNRLCTQVADRHGFGFANVNLRTYYAEGAKTMGFEIVEQLGWRFPKHVVAPIAGGTLLPRVYKGFSELQALGLADGPLPRMYGAQAAGCAPVVRALHEGLEYPDPVKPDTIAKSIAIGNPADGFQVLEVLRASDGWAEAVTDDEILAGIQLLAETEGIFTEPAGGTTMAVTRKLIEQGRIPRDEPIVVCITGNGYKTAELMLDRTPRPIPLSRSISDFDAFLAAQTAGASEIRS